MQVTRLASLSLSTLALFIVTIVLPTSAQPQVQEKPCCGEMAIEAPQPESKSCCGEMAAQAEGDQKNCCGGMADHAMTDQKKPCCGGMGMDMNPDHMADMELFHFLLDHRTDIRRTVTLRPDGIEILTEPDAPGVAAQIQVHVASMYARMTEGRAIYQRDPFFQELFRHADAITMDLEDTAAGFRVVATSADSYVVKLIQAHAEVVNQFLTNGRAEIMKNHEVPARP